MNKPDYVWAVIEGVSHEGYDVVAIYTNEAAAEARKESIIKAKDGRGPGCHYVDVEVFPLEE